MNLMIDSAAKHATWPDEGVSRIPYWIYSDPSIYQMELERIFYKDAWSFVGLSAQVPNSGDYLVTHIGERPVILVRGEDGKARVLENRCAHRGVKFCRERFGATKEFICPYHQWSFDLEGNLNGVPFLRGVKHQGGMPKDFKKNEHGLNVLNVTERHGVIFASFSENMESLEDYLGKSMLGYFDRVFDGRPLKVLGQSRQLIPSNWKLMFENIKDPYHASLLHVFLVTFGLFRADQPSAVQMDSTGRHSVLVSRKGEKTKTSANKDIRNLREDFQLNDPTLLQPVKEFPGDNTVVMQTLWPNLIIQQQSNTIATRQIIPKGPDKFELCWTYFAYEDDDEEMLLRRLRQANLMGCSGLVSIDDSEVMKLCQESVEPSQNSEGIVEMGGHGTEDTEHMVTETAIRAFYSYYRKVMDL